MRERGNIIEEGNARPEINILENKRVEMDDSEERVAEGIPNRLWIFRNRTPSRADYDIGTIDRRSAREWRGIQEIVNSLSQSCLVECDKLMVSLLHRVPD